MLSKEIPSNLEGTFLKLQPSFVQAISSSCEAMQVEKSRSESTYMRYQSR